MDVYFIFGKDDSKTDPSIYRCKKNKSHDLNTHLKGHLRLIATIPNMRDKNINLSNVKHHSNESPDNV